jgi:hypothetical protein
MALLLNISESNSEYGIAFSGVYYRIVRASVQRELSENHQVMIDLSGYATNSPTDDTRELDFKRLHGPLSEIEAKSGDDFLSKCYNWLKDQSEFSGASDA